MKIKFVSFLVRTEISQEFEEDSGIRAIDGYGSEDGYGNLEGPRIFVWLIRLPMEGCM
jgi:hypothetical protein